MSKYDQVEEEDCPIVLPLNTGKKKIKTEV